MSIIGCYRDTHCDAEKCCYSRDEFCLCDRPECFRAKRYMFVYGILMRDAKIPAKLHGHKLDFFGHATITPSEKDFVLGGIVPVDADKIRFYDLVEHVDKDNENNGLYFRKTVSVQTNDGAVDSFVYQMTHKYRYNEGKDFLKTLLTPMMLEEYKRLGHNSQDIEEVLDSEYLRSIGLSW